MNYILNFKDFQILENYNLRVDQALFKTRKEEEEACISFAMGYTPNAKRAYIPEHGYGAVESDFHNGVCNLKVALNKNSFYEFSPYITKDDSRYDSMRAEYTKEFGNIIAIKILNGTPEMKLTGTVVMIAAGKYWQVGNYDNPGGYKSTMSKVMDAIYSSDTSAEFEPKISKIANTISDRVILKHNDAFRKIALAK